MKRRKSLIVMTLLAAPLFLPAAVPSTAVCDDPQAADVKAKQEKETATPDNISVGGKTLSQWRALFGESTQKQGDGIIFSQTATDTTSSKAIKKKTSQTLRSYSFQTLLAPQPEGRQTAQRIIRDAQKVYWTRLTIIANNLANADTVAYKRNRTLLEGINSLADMKGNDYSTQGQMAAAGIAPPGGGPLLKIQTDFRQGRLIKTGHMLDIAIEGNGFFQVVNSRTGDIIYTRAGNLSVNSNGDLTVGRYEANVGNNGLLIEPSINVPQDATSVFIDPMGVISVKQPGSTTMSEIGQIQLASFINPQGLQRLGGKFFGETDFSGPPIMGNPGEDSLGVIRQGHLECSNVNLAKELADYNAAAKRIKTLRRAIPK